MTFALANFLKQEPKNKNKILKQDTIEFVFTNISKLKTFNNIVLRYKSMYIKNI